MRKVLSLLVPPLVLVGFYVLAAVCLLGLAFGGGMLLVVTGGNGVVFLLEALALGLLIGTLFVALAPFREKPYVPRGIPLYRSDAPALWATLGELADTVGTRPPDQVWLAPEMNAAVVEQPRLLGLLPGRRYLLIGLPLLQALPLRQVRAVLAHEFGHYGHQDGRLTALGHRGHLAVGRMLERFPRRSVNPLSWLFRGYARLFVLVQRAASRRQELAADRVMARVAGREAAQSALRSQPVLGAEWHRYLNAYVRAGLDAELAPSEVFGGFARLVEARRDWLATTERPHRPPSRWDTHPPLADRLWALETAPEDGHWSEADDAAGDRSALELLPDAAASAARLEAAVFDFGTCRRLPWDSYPREAALAYLRDSAATAYRAIAHATGQRQGSLADVLAFCTAGDEDALLMIGAEEDGLESAVLLAAYEAGSVQYVHAWDGRQCFVRPDGSPVDLPGIVDELLSATLGNADRARAALAALGVDPAAAMGGDQRPAPRRATVTGAIAHVKLDEQIGFLFLTDLGLLHLPLTGKPEGTGKQLLLRLLTESPAALAARHHARWLPYEEFARVERHRDIPIKATVTLRSGTAHRIQALYSGYSHGSSHQTILGVLGQYGQG